MTVEACEILNHIHSLISRTGGNQESSEILSEYVLWLTCSIVAEGQVYRLAFGSKVKE